MHSAPPPTAGHAEPSRSQLREICPAFGHDEYVLSTNMSMSFYAHRETPDGPEFSDGPNFSNANARTILRSLGYGAELLDDDDQPGPLDPGDLVAHTETRLG